MKFREQVDYVAELVKLWNVRARISTPVAGQ